MSDPSEQKFYTHSSVESNYHNQISAKTTFLAEGTEAAIDNIYLKKSLYINSNLQSVDPNEVNALISPMFNIHVLWNRS